MITRGQLRTGIWAGRAGPEKKNKEQRRDQEEKATVKEITRDPRSDPNISDFHVTLTVSSAFSLVK
jgi:hypothetical protein